MPRTRSAGQATGAYEFAIEYIWQAEDGHTLAFAERFDGREESLARKRLGELREELPVPGRPSGGTCPGCQEPRRVVCILRRQAVGGGSDRPQPAVEVETWTWTPPKDRAS